MGKAWSAEDLKILKDAYDAGIQQKEIAKRLNRTYSAVKSKLIKAGFIKPPEKIQVSNGFDDFNIIVPTSGGKDSLACLLLALEMFPEKEILPVFNDTGWEHPATYEYLDTLEDFIQIKIIRIVTQSLPELIRKKQQFPFARGRFCTSYLKQHAFRNYYRDHIYDGTNWEVWYGMRQQESTNRARRYFDISYDDLFDPEDVFPSEFSKKARKTLRMRLPVADWSTNEIFSYIKYYNAPLNPLYAEGNKRVGCYPCMLASKPQQELMLNTEYGKKRLEEISILEKEIGKKYEMFDTDQGSCELCKI